MHFVAVTLYEKPGFVNLAEVTSVVLSDPAPNVPHSATTLRLNFTNGNHVDLTDEESIDTVIRHLQVLSSSALYQIGLRSK